MKLWEGRFAQPSAKSADDFNQSLSFDKKLYWHDIFASIAHVKMLGETKILPAEDVEKICDTLKIEGGQCTDDLKFSLDATRCIGCCGLAPVMTVNDDVYGKVSVEEVEGILAKYRD